MRRLSAAAFGLWLTGLGSAFCCGPAGRDAQAREDAASARDESAAAPGGHCAAHRARTSDNAVVVGVVANTFATASRVMVGTSSCCGRACRHPYPTSRVATGNELAFVCILENVSRASGATSEITRPEARGHSPDGRATHVRCCVFRI